VRKDDDLYISNINPFISIKNLLFLFPVGDVRFFSGLIRTRSGRCSCRFDSSVSAPVDFLHLLESIQFSQPIFPSAPSDPAPVFISPSAPASFSCLHFGHRAGSRSAEAFRFPAAVRFSLSIFHRFLSPLDLALFSVGLRCPIGQSWSRPRESSAPAFISLGFGPAPADFRFLLRPRTPGCSFSSSAKARGRARLRYSCLIFVFDARQWIFPPASRDRSTGSAREPKARPFCLLQKPCRSD
jgi:hypothetical protein